MARWVGARVSGARGRLAAALLEAGRDLARAPSVARPRRHGRLPQLWHGCGRGFVRLTEGYLGREGIHCGVG
jgi:hypothetical protein